MTAHEQGFTDRLPFGESASGRLLKENVTVFQWANAWSDQVSSYLSAGMIARRPIPDKGLLVGRYVFARSR